jgi:mono/diheme cytochrome c family protein
MLYAAIGLLGIVGVARAGNGPPPLDPAAVKTGRAVYLEYCASCHGTKGEGAANWQKLDAQGEMPAPPHDRHGHTWKHSDAMLYRIVQRGWRDPFNKTERLTMPGFAAQLSPKQTVAVVTYLKTLWTQEQRRFQWEESQREPFPPAAR